MWVVIVWVDFGILVFFVDEFIVDVEVIVEGVFNVIMFVNYFLVK